MSLTLRDHAALIRERIAEWEALPRCRRCLIPSRFRDATIDDQGVCNLCTDYLELVRTVEGGRREAELVELLERHRGRDADHDVVVCWSGGKDSTWLLDRFQNEYGLRVLAVTVDTGLGSAAARENIAVATGKLGVDHCWLEADPRLLEVYRWGLLARSDKGLECDVCDLCDNSMRRRILELALERRIPVVVHGADHFQIIDSGLDLGQTLLHDEEACWPSVARARGVFRELFALPALASAPRPPVELYPFLYLPYDEEAICEELEDKGLVVETNPDATNCELVFLINVLELVRSGYPAYIHQTSAAILQGELDVDQARAELSEWLAGYAEGRYDEQVLAPLPKLGLSFSELLAPGPAFSCPAESVRGIRRP